MTSQNQNGNGSQHATQSIAPSATLDAVRSAVEHHGGSRDELIPILTEVNRTVGYLPAEALNEISRLTRVPKSQLFSVATFYRMLSTEKRGRHVVQFCESAPCHVVGGRQVWEALQDAARPGTGRNQPGWKVDPGDRQLPGCLRRWPGHRRSMTTCTATSPRRRYPEILAHYE